MNKIPSYVVKGRVLYCGEPNWAYIGKDPDSGKPVLRNTITGSFIAADEYKITMPIDYEHLLLIDIESILDGVAEKGQYSIGGLPALIILADGLNSMGYTDGNTNSSFTILGILSNTMEDMMRTIDPTNIWRSDLEIMAARNLFAANIRKNKIVVAS